MTPDIERYVNELRQTTMAAMLNYDIWRVYKCPSVRKAYTDDVMNEYVEFFRTSIHAHFVAMIVLLSRLYEKRSKKKSSISIPSLIEKSRHCPQFSGSLISSLETMCVDQAKPIWKKLYLLRNEAFAHLSSERDITDVFAAAKLNINDPGKLIDITKTILNKFSYAMCRETCDFNVNARDHTLRLLKTLKNAKSANSS